MRRSAIALITILLTAQATPVAAAWGGEALLEGLLGINLPSRETIEPLVDCYYNETCDLSQYNVTVAANGTVAITPLEPEGDGDNATSPPSQGSGDEATQSDEGPEPDNSGDNDTAEPTSQDNTGSDNDTSEPTAVSPVSNTTHYDAYQQDAPANATADGNGTHEPNESEAEGDHAYYRSGDRNKYWNTTIINEASGIDPNLIPIIGLLVAAVVIVAVVTIVNGRQGGNNDEEDDGDDETDEKDGEPAEATSDSASQATDEKKEE